VKKLASVRRNAYLCASLAASFLSACASAPPAHYYTLLGSPAKESASMLMFDHGPDVVIASVNVPEAVDRSEIVIRSGVNSVAIMENQRWAESLKQAIPRAIADDLSQILNGATAKGKDKGATVVVQSDHAGHDAKYHVYIDIIRYDSVLDDAAFIEAIWSVRLATAGQVAGGKSSLRVPVRGPGFEHLVAAHATALAQLSSEIATQIQIAEAKVK
jgi:uncharacterized protein